MADGKNRGNDSDFPLRNSYVDQCIRNGYRRKCAYPDNGVPPQKKTGREGMPSLLASAFKIK